jgi:hypothetical protein
MFGSDRHERKINSLLTQLDFFEAVLERHKIWVDDVDDPEIERVHIEIMGLLRQTRGKYNELLDKYNHRSQ